MCIFSGLFMMFWMILFFGVIFCLGIIARFFILYPRLAKIAKLFNTEVNYISFYHWEVVGEYKGRIVSIEYGKTRSLDSDGFYIEPKSNIPAQKLFVINYPRPTKHTKLLYGRIYYDPMTLGAVFGDFFLGEKK